MKTDVDATSMSRRTGGSRPVTALGAALVGVGVVSALASHTPTPPDVQVPTVTADNGVRLAGNSVANIPTNLLQTIANMPAVEYEGMNKTSEALENSSNWWLYIPTNVIGFDQQDKQKLEGTTLMMVPIPLVAQANFEQWWITMAANAPMTENCTGIPGPCSDVFYFDQYGQVPTWQLVLGYRFPEIRNTIDPNHETYTTPEGKVVEIQPDWSGKYYKLDPWGPQKAIWETLTQDPTGYRPAPTADQWLKALNRLGKASWIGLNPNVEGTYCLPCQLGGIKGAPDSLPKQYLFGNYYSFFDFGQPQTEHNWVYNRPDYDEKSRLDYIEVRNGRTRRSSSNCSPTPALRPHRRLCARAPRSSTRTWTRSANRSTRTSRSTSRACRRHSGSRWNPARTSSIRSRNRLARSQSRRRVNLVSRYAARSR